MGFNQFSPEITAIIEAAKFVTVEGKQQEWEAFLTSDTCSKPTSDLYSFSHNWARYMQTQLNEGSTLESIWHASLVKLDANDDLSHRATGTVALCLKRFWVHGEALWPLVNGYYNR